METFTKNSSFSELNTEKSYNLNMIEVLCRGDKEKIKKMICLFVEQMPSSIEQLKIAESGMNYLEITKIAHRIKPILAYYSLTEIEKNITILEQATATVASTVDLKTIIHDLSKSVSNVIEELKKDFSLY
jgi:HPt (histidine-containing phosphotransfer) domain-containing protein